MVKGADAVARKKNKVRRKKNQKKEGSSVSARVASIIAAKKRRLTGVRRKCQGMCFSLPTPEDPFNEGRVKMAVNKKDANRIASSVQVPRRLGSCNSGSLHNNAKEVVKETIENMNRPSKFLSLCLNVIEESLRSHWVLGIEADKPLFTDLWGFEFLKSYMSGKDVLDTSGLSCSTKQIAWLAAVAADSISRKENDGLSFPSPFFLFLVPSRERASQVRSICKPLRGLGIHSVSVHSGAPLDHQVKGLKSCEPEFLISTPDRLLELISLGAIDVSGVSFMVIDADSSQEDKFIETLKLIKKCINFHPYTVAFSNSLRNASASDVQEFFPGPVNKISFNDSIVSQAAHILQTIDVCRSEEEKLSKGLQVLHYGCDNPNIFDPLRVLYVVGKKCESNNLSEIFKANGYFISKVGEEYNIYVSDCPNSHIKYRLSICVIKEEQVQSVDLHSFETVILMDFVESTEIYLHILTTMARNVPNGYLISFLTNDQARLADGLIEILEQCRQNVPNSLKVLKMRHL